MIADTARDWTDVGPSAAGRGSLDGETESVVRGPGDGGGTLPELYDHIAAAAGVPSWYALAGFFDGDLSARRLRPADEVSPGGAWRLRPDLDVSAAVGGESCGSDGATSPSYSPAGSSTGSAA